MLNKEIIELLNRLVGVSMSTAEKYLVDNRLYGKYTLNKNGKTAENIVAMIIGERFPSNRPGADFTKFEVKSIDVKKIKNGDSRTKGDTPICKLKETEKDFLTSNTWNKTENLVLVLIYNDLIDDIKYFNGTSFKSILKKDYKNCLNKGSRNKSDILVRKGFKDGDVIMIKNSESIKLSNTIINSKNIITDQYTYISELFENKVDEYQAYVINNNTNPIDRLRNLHNKLKELRLTKSEVLDLAIVHKEIGETLNVFIEELKEAC
jgi:hypothetical protein